MKLFMQLVPPSLVPGPGEYESEDLAQLVVDKRETSVSPVNQSAVKPAARMVKRDNQGPCSAEKQSLTARGGPPPQPWPWPACPSHTKG